MIRLECVLGRHLNDLLHFACNVFIYSDILVKCNVVLENVITMYYTATCLFSTLNKNVMENIFGSLATQIIMQIHRIKNWKWTRTLYRCYNCLRQNRKKLLIKKVPLTQKNQSKIPDSSGPLLDYNDQINGPKTLLHQSIKFYEFKNPIFPLLEYDTANHQTWSLFLWLKKSVQVELLTSVAFDICVLLFLK